MRNATLFARLLIVIIMLIMLLITLSNCGGKVNAGVADSKWVLIGTDRESGCKMYYLQQMPYAVWSICPPGYTSSVSR